jgi:hypothetical protein
MARASPNQAIIHAEPSQTTPAASYEPMARCRMLDEAYLTSAMIAHLRYER